MGKIHLDLLISGKVQGVWYRKSAVEQAIRLQLAGFAMNMPDGTVRIEAEGPREPLDRFVEWCRTGPPRAVVAHIEVTEGPFVGHAGFHVRR
jgi:acylphosphatase